MTVAKPHTFVATNTILSAQNNANFDALFVTLGLADYDSQHNANGTHKAITGPSATFTGNITSSGGNLAINGTSTLTGAVTCSTTLAVTGASTLNGAVTLGDGVDDDVVVTGRIASDIDPKTTNTHDLGSASLKYKDIHVAGVGSVAALTDVASVDATTTDSVIANFDGANADTVVATFDAANADSIAALTTSAGSNDISEARTRPTSATAGLGEIAISSSSGDATVTTTTLTDVTNLSISLATSGRPVRIVLQPDGASSQSAIATYDTDNLSDYDSAYLSWRLLRDAVTVGRGIIGSKKSIVTNAKTCFAAAPGCIEAFDDVAAGTYTYKLQISISQTTTIFGESNLGDAGTDESTNTAVVYFCKLVAYEL